MMMREQSPLVDVRQLDVALPGGTTVASAVDLSVGPGEVVALIGSSGAGKTTLVRALLDPDDLRALGYKTSWKRREIRTRSAFLPQRGALLDHLDVIGNIRLAQAATGETRDPAEWLHAVDLDPSFAQTGTSVNSLSGGQAQRVAIARALAAGRRILVLDEPSVGLDPLGVRLLARVLVQQARELKACVLVITHDLVFAGGASDRILLLDTSRHKLVDVLPAWTGPAEMDSDDERTRKLTMLAAEVEHLLLGIPATAASRGSGRPTATNSLHAIRTAGEAAIRCLDPRLAKESAVVLLRSAMQAFVRPTLFYATVGLLLGITVPYVIVHISPSLKASAVLSLIGGSYILSLAPPLSAIVFAATSGNAINAWLGGMRLNGQVLALSGLGVSPERYLWSPAWLALAVSYALTFGVFVIAMVAGGYALFSAYDVPHALAKLTADFLDPPASRIPYLVRGLWLVAVYAVALASIVVAKASAAKSKSEDVTSSMTSSVMQCTVFVVVMELASVAILFALTEAG